MLRISFNAQCQVPLTTVLKTGRLRARRHLADLNKIGTISEKDGRLGHESKYDDFPDEEQVWTSIYEENPHCNGNIKERPLELMLRPPYPPIYNENQMPDVSEISEITVIGGDSWRVGDLVDWWNSDCYWSGKITELFGDDEAQVELKPKPIGEGLSYRVLLKDLRPSLDWSPELGWTIPTQEDEIGRPCARLVKPINQVVQRASRDTEAGSSAQSFLSSPVSSNSADLNAKKSKTATKTKTSSLGKKVSKKPKKRKEREPVNSSTRKTSLLSSDSLKNEPEPAAEIVKEEPSLNFSRNKCTGSGGLTLHSKRSDHPEAAILHLEEYLNKVKWLKKMVQCGISSSDAKRPQWEFMG